jgi:hypothetical protein
MSIQRFLRFMSKFGAGAFPNHLNHSIRRITVQTMCAMRRRMCLNHFQGGDGRKGTNRVLRGGSWNNNGRNLRSAYRDNNDPSNANDNNGFRLAQAHSRSETGL